MTNFKTLGQIVLLCMSVLGIVDFGESFVSNFRNNLSNRMYKSCRIACDSEKEKSFVVIKTCKCCKKQYNFENQPGMNLCSFHPGIYSGRLNRINDVDTSDLEYFWSCCGQDALTSQGCIVSRTHTSYDDDHNPKYSVFTGKQY